jgi:hypothetical protein
VRIHRFITGTFIAYAVLTNACMMPVVSANAPDADPHAHHRASHEADGDSSGRHESDCAHGHCLGHGLPAAITEETVAQGAPNHVVSSSLYAVQPFMIDSVRSHALPLVRPDPPGRIRTVVLRY